MAYSTIEIEGGMFPADLLDAIASGEEREGQRPVDFGLGPNARLTDEIQGAFSDARSYWDSYNRKMSRKAQPSVTLTREDWMKPVLEGLLGFPTLPYRAEALTAGGQEFVISHPWEKDGNFLPIHISDFEENLDRRAGRARRSAHASVQEYLNRSDAVWGVVSNGGKLRLLRDSVRFSKPTFLEFDLQGMLEGNQYSEFSLFYRLTHATRFPQDLGSQDECLLENYYQKGIDDGARVREKLRVGVEQALGILGNAFLAHPGSEALRSELDSGRLDQSEYYRQLLKLIYRLLFLMVAEERKLIYPKDRSGSPAHAVYHRYYSVEQLRARADRYFYGDQNTDLWQGLAATFRLFRDDATASRMALSALNGDLFGADACALLEASHCTNYDLLRALRALSVFESERGVIDRVHYAGLDVEELGSVYESLLEYRPVVSTELPRFTLAGSGDRRQTGSYYTHPDLVRELVNSALVPVVEDRLANIEGREEMEAALLDLKVCDPASGSGHFVLAAARRIATELARVRGGEEEPTPEVYREALRDVIRRCIYAVDKNPLAVDLCKVALWIEGHNAGLPLSFLDNHIKHGDSLVGVIDLQVLDDGIPDDAYKPLAGDDKPTARVFLDKNKRERAGQFGLGAETLPPAVPASIANNFNELASLVEGNGSDVSAKAEMYEDLRGGGTDWHTIKIACDLWTAAFFTPLASGTTQVPTTGTIRHWYPNRVVQGQLTDQVEERSVEMPYFHWPLEFPEVFVKGGFDVVLGNPPWDKVEMNEVQYFQSVDEDIAMLTGARRKNAIASLEQDNPPLWKRFVSDKETIARTAQFFKTSGQFRLTAKGRMNLFGLFAERSMYLSSNSGRTGVVIPSSIAADHTFKEFFGYVIENGILDSLFDFENREGFFQGVDSRYRFCLFTLTGPELSISHPRFAFYLSNPLELSDTEKVFFISEQDILLMNPNTRTCPIFRSRKDMDLVRTIYLRLPVMVNHSVPKNDRNLMFMSDLFNMTSDSHEFLPEKLPNTLPLLEGKMIQAYEHRAASIVTNESNVRRPAQPEPTRIEEYADAHYEAKPQYWVSDDSVDKSLQRIGSASISALLVYKMVSSPTNERTLIAAIVPKAGIGNSLNVIVPLGENYCHELLWVLANLNAFSCDYVVRQKTAGVNLNLFTMEQIPVVPERDYYEICNWDISQTLAEWVTKRSLELSYTSWALNHFVQELDERIPPFVWDAERRFLIQCELDAAFFMLYGMGHDDVDYIMETFPIVKRHDIRDHGNYRTKQVVLEIYDEMQQAINTSADYQTRLNPPPGDYRATHEVGNAV